ncbi:hypothetical protein D9M72_404880 [compost metagenome]
MIGPDHLASGQGKALALIDRQCPPGAARAEAVDSSCLEVGDHLRGRDYDGVHVPQWMDTLGRQPVVQPHGMGAGGEGLGEGQSRTAMVHMPGQRLGTGHANALEGFGEVDGLAVLAEPHEDRHFGAGATDTQFDAIHLSIERLRGIQLSGEQFVAQGGPGRLALQVQGQAVWLCKALGRGDYQRGRVGQGHEAQVEHALLRRVAAGDPGQVVRAHGVLLVRHVECHLSAKMASIRGGRNRRHRHQPAPPLERAALSLMKQAICQPKKEPRDGGAGFGGRSYLNVR